MKSFLDNENVQEDLISGSVAAVVKLAALLCRGKLKTR